jgi:hypothetical protein
MEQKKDFCCANFQRSIEDVGQRGIAVLVHRSSIGIGFLLQSRGINFEDEKKIKPISIDIKINVSSEIGIQFCPFCGCHLRDLINKNPTLFDDLAKKHRPFNSNVI